MIAGRNWSAGEAVAGLLAAAAVFAGFFELFYRPFRIAPAALLVALCAAGMSREQQRLVWFAVAVIGLCFVIGAAIAVWLTHPLY